MTQGKSRMRQFRTSGSVRGVAREGDSYRDSRSMVRQAHHERLQLPLVLSSSKDTLRSKRSNLEAAIVFRWELHVCSIAQIPETKIVFVKRDRDRPRGLSI
jgi:hypothetical protein